ncbi:hypothetical protein A2304_03315 [Candidatus Uhrbacteria bacterium RIFOXYB2_FULL_57_15]|uniref:Uncharacterized protein n=1 Tax=Candidatus Uhrbacteria bacterium RIFOXYB2_FULL_57_15 TaxID=1802422 RepID=A0A1F7WAP5_9BACT|nr:MAG: hypothetical protein A2501_02485 [Candidatus Uhrbacteria bacterium RIFOXYC12_FULL_57_11]OGL99154.1 MAG: hypothetical protein A2304_03315 [Candidatus Uhrbacteria bacterium RIFOXYB2_FULL_57_15]
MNRRQRKMGSIFFGLVYLMAGLTFMFYPVDIWGNKSTMWWLITTFSVGDPIMNVLWILVGSVGFLLTGGLLLVVPFLNTKS